MKRWILGVLALVVAVSATASAQTDEERRELERRLRELQRELREVERQLGRERGGLLEMIEPLTLSVMGNRARLGVVVNTGRDSEADSLGAELRAVTPDGPADEAGLEVGDIIVSLNGIPIARSGRRDDSPGEKVSEFSAELEEGDVVEVVYLRDGETRTTTLTARPVSSFAYAYTPRGLEIDDSGIRVLGRAYSDSLARSYRGLAEDLRDRIRVQTWEAEPGTGTAWSMSFGGRWGDLELTTLDEDLGAYFGTTEGLLVVRAPEEEWLNLQSGDVILRIGGRLPRSPSQALRILRSFEPGDEIQLDIMRNKQRTTVTATVEEGDRGFFWEDGK
jgi:type II secretory pathway pseudopilin PulG